MRITVQSTDLKLTIELVPRPCWYHNVRSQVKPKYWHKIIADVSAKAGAKCEICGGVGDKWPVECHEIWNFEHTDDPNVLILRLTGFIALCPLCHLCKHIGYAEVTGQYDKAVTHLKKINNITDDDLKLIIKATYRAWSDLNKHDWKIDLSYLDTVNIPYTEIGLLKSTKS
jgi:hypothetical protein